MLLSASFDQALSALSNNAESNILNEHYRSGGKILKWYICWFMHGIVQWNSEMIWCIILKTVETIHIYYYALFGSKYVEVVWSVIG